MFDRVIEAAEAATKTESFPDRDVEYHLARARSERDLAYRAADACVSDAHMRLSALHLQRALMLRGRQPGLVGDIPPQQEPRAPWLWIQELPSTR